MNLHLVQNFTVGLKFQFSDNNNSVLLPDNSTCKYRSVEWFSQNFNASASNLSMIHFNTRSLPKNLHKIEELLHLLKFKPDILAISESKLNNNNLNQALLNNYHMLCTNSLSSSGGVAIFIADNIKFNKLDEFSIANDNAETLFVEIDTPGKSKNLVIGTIYRHPAANFHTFQEELCSTFGQLADDNVNESFVVILILIFSIIN